MPVEREPDLVLPATVVAGTVEELCVARGYRNSVREYAAIGGRRDPVAYRDDLKLRAGERIRGRVTAGTHTLQRVEVLPSAP